MYKFKNGSIIRITSVINELKSRINLLIYGQRGLPPSQKAGNRWWVSPGDASRTQFGILFLVMACWTPEGSWIKRKLQNRWMVLMLKMQENLTVKQYISGKKTMLRQDRTGVPPPQVRGPVLDCERVGHAQTFLPPPCCCYHWSAEPESLGTTDLEKNLE